MHNFNNKTDIFHFDHSHTEPAPDNSLTLAAIAQKEDNATECLILISENDNDELRDYSPSRGWNLLSNIEVAPWPQARFNRRLDENCGRSKTSMLLPPYNEQENYKGAQRRKIVGNKENYLSIDKLLKEEKIPVGKKYSTQIKKCSSTISKYEDENIEGQNFSVEQFSQAKKSKPNIVYVRCDEESYLKTFMKPTKKVETNEAYLAPIVIGKCSLVKKNSKVYSETRGLGERQKSIFANIPTEGNVVIKDRKKGLQNIRVGESKQSFSNVPGLGKGKENAECWKIKKKIEEHIKKESHIKLSLDAGKSSGSKQAKRYMKYSQCKIKQIQRKEPENHQASRQLWDPSTKGISM